MTSAPEKVSPRTVGKLQRGTRLALAGGMVVAGIAHLVSPAPYVNHLPPWVPQRELIVYVSGVMEISLGLALAVLRAERKMVGRLLVAFLVLVFPANVYVAVADVQAEGVPSGAWAWIRLPLQALLVAAVLWSTSEDPPGPEGADPVRSS